MALRDVFQSKLAELEPESVAKYSRTIRVLDAFLTAHSLALDTLTDTAVADWAVALLADGLKKSSVVRHLNILSSLLKRAAERGLTVPRRAPREVAKTMSEAGFSVPVLIEGGIADRLLVALRKTAERTPIDDLITFALLNGPMPLSQAIRLRRSDLGEGLDAASQAIVDRNVSPQRKYVFPLMQSYHTPAQIAAGVSARLARLAPELTGLDPEAVVASLFAALAMRGGATASQALALTGGSAPYAIPAFVKAAALPAGTAAELRENVATMLSPESPRWYALHMRRGVTFDDLSREIAARVNPTPELFYPCHTIKTKAGHRLRPTTRPILAGTVFFRTRPADIRPMFAAVGHMAWCYRLSTTPDAPYAVISAADMRRFQAAVGSFTPDTDVVPAGTLIPRPGETVLLITPGLEHRPALVTDILPASPGADSIIVRVSLTTDAGYEWRMTVDPRQIAEFKSASLRS